MKLNQEKMLMTKKVFSDIEKTIGSCPPECGGVLGAGEDGIVTAYYFDHTGEHSERGYAPDVKEINHVLEEEWMPRGLYMVGLVHSHENGVGVPSCMDVGYGIRILQALDTVNVLYLPIVTLSENGMKMDVHMVCRDPERGFSCKSIPVEVLG